MKEAYCSLKVAKFLKEKGFLQDVDLRTTQNLSYYDNIGLCHNLSKYYDSLIQNKIDFVIAPTHQMACAWLREKHGLHISTCPIENCSNDADGNVCDRWSFWSFDICSVYDGQYIYQDYEQFRLSEFQTHEEAVEAALKYSLETLL